MSCLDIMLRVPRLALVLGLVSCGCASSYSWKSSVPPEVRTVSVPTFRNESDVMELGAIAARQVGRELQREGTFKLASTDDAALEIQGTIKSVKTKFSANDRLIRRRVSTYDFSVQAVVSVIDRRTHKVLVDNRTYSARTVLTSGEDLSTARRGASGRLMDDLSRQVVDDLLNMKW